MFTTIQQWYHRMWQPTPKAASYLHTFSTEHGTVVLQDLLDSIYCTVCESTDPIALAEHNGRRTVVQGILRNIDLARSPSKYEPVQAEQKSPFADEELKKHGLAF